MSKHTDPLRGDPEQTLREELVLMVRAERRLREHELTRRRALLAVTIALPTAGCVLAALGEPFAAGGLVASGLACGAARRS
jgi:hypothetical protein